VTKKIIVGSAAFHSRCTKQLMKNIITLKSKSKIYPVRDYEGPDGM
jgi:hypothetical protein